MKKFALAFAGLLPTATVVAAITLPLTRAAALHDALVVLGAAALGSVELGILDAREVGRPVEYRHLEGWS